MTRVELSYICEKMTDPDIACRKGQDAMIENHNQNLEAVATNIQHHQRNRREKRRAEVQKDRFPRKERT